VYQQTYIETVVMILKDLKNKDRLSLLLLWTLLIILPSKMNMDLRVELLRS